MSRPNLIAALISQRDALWWSQDALASFGPRGTPPEFRCRACHAWFGSIAAIEVLARDVRPSLQADIKRAVLIGR
jgi:hypothetical protein